MKLNDEKPDLSFMMRKASPKQFADCEGSGGFGISRGMLAEP